MWRRSLRKYVEARTTAAHWRDGFHPRRCPLIFRFGEFELHEEAYLLTQAGRPIAVPQLAFETILFLLKNRGRVVDKEDLIAGPWRGIVVGDDAIHLAIKRARRALSDTGDSPRIIETVRGRGFRFLGQVTTEQRLPASDRESNANPHPLARAAPSGRGGSHPADSVPRFFGRATEVQRLRAAFTAANSGRGAIVLVSGGPGIGKTTLVREFGAWCSSGGATVLSGTCWEGGGSPAFWPWHEVLRACASMREAVAVPYLSEVELADVGRLFPYLFPGALRPDSATAADDTPQTRFRVLDTVARYLCAAAAQGTAVVVLEDLHAADDAALELLEYLRQRVADHSLLVVGTCRSLEAVDRPVLEAALRGASPNLESIALEELSEEDVLTWLEAARGGHVTRAAVASVYRATLGHPFLLASLLHSLPARWTPDQLERLELHAIKLPERISSSLRLRLARLPRRTLEALHRAAAYGRGFPAALLLGQGAVEGELPEVLEPALAASVLEVSQDVGEDYRFSHTLLRETLYYDLPLSERLDCHAEVGRWLLARLASDPDRIFQAAHHLLLASDRHAPESAVNWTVQAVEHAQRRAAYEVASHYAARALAVIDRHMPDDPRRIDLLFAQARALHHAARTQQAATAYQDIAEWSAARGLTEIHAQAVLGWFDVLRERSIIDEAFQAALEQALGGTLLAGGTLAQLLAVHGVVKQFAAPSHRRKDQLNQALSMARESRDPKAISTVLDVISASNVRVSDGAGMLALTEEMLEASEASGQVDRALEAVFLRSTYLLELGRTREAFAQLADYQVRARLLSYPSHLWRTDAAAFVLAFLRADLVEAEAAARRARALCEPLFGVAGTGWFGGHLFQLALEADGERALAMFGEIEACAKAILEAAPQHLTWHVVMVLVALNLDRREEAAAGLDAFLGGKLAGTEAEGHYRLWLAILAQASVGLDDRESARILIELLTPYNGTLVSSADVYLGPASYYLAKLWHAVGEPRRARQLFERATQESKQASSRTFLAWSQFGWARTLPAGGEEASLRSTLLEEASRTARECGMMRLQREIGEWG